MPQDMIDHVNQLSKADGQLKLLMFFDHKGSPVSNSESPSPANTPVKIAGVPAKDQAKDPPIEAAKPASMNDLNIQAVPEE